jgi:hypothetical protein
LKELGGATMLDERIEIGARLNELTALQWAADLAQLDLDPSRRAILDFSRTSHFEPFGMLFLGSAIRRLQSRARLAGAEVVVRPSDADGGFAGHMGFWNSVGLTHGRHVNAPAGKETYLPLTRIDIADLYRQAGGGDPRGAGVVNQEAARLAKVLANPYGEPLFEAITYALRELFRNVLEHAMSESLWVAGMSWPKRDYVQVAIVDEGRGIRHSLADHSEFRFATDAEAIRESLKAGVTRNKGRQLSRAQSERWQDEGHILPLGMFDNTGYGLYMISTFCREAGQFLIASGSSYLAFVSSAEVSGSSLHRGTALRLVLEPTKVGSAFDRLFEVVQSRGIAGPKPLLSASKLRKLGLESLAGGGGDSGATG